MTIASASWSSRHDAAHAYDANEIALAHSFVDQAVIAIENMRLFNETKEALAKVEERTLELTETLDYQTAISSVLRCISESPTDVAPVFNVILESATRLFGSPIAAVFRYDGQLVHLVAAHNWSPEALEDARRFYPAPPNPKMMSGRVVISGRVQTIADTLHDPDYDQTQARLGHWRRMLGAPLLKDGQAVGAIVVAWPEPGETPQRQIDLLQTFAGQAVIAIENVRLINETKEALERQTATSEVLKVISDHRRQCSRCSRRSSRAASACSQARWCRSTCWAPTAASISRPTTARTASGSSRCSRCRATNRRPPPGWRSCAAASCTTPMSTSTRSFPPSARGVAGAGRERR